MSATTAQPGEAPIGEELATRFQRFRAKARTKTKKAGKRTVAALRNGARSVGRNGKRAAKACGRGIKRSALFIGRSAKTTAKGVVRGVGYLGLTLSWLVRAALTLLTGLVGFVAVFIFATLTALTFAILAILSYLQYGWAVVVHMPLAYMAGRAPEGVTGLRSYVRHRTAKSKTRADRAWSRMQNAWRTATDDVKGPETRPWSASAPTPKPKKKKQQDWVQYPLYDPDDPDDPDFVPFEDRQNYLEGEELSPAPEAWYAQFDPHEGAAIEALHDKEALVAQGDWDNKATHFPGADTGWVTDDPKQMYGEIGTQYKLHFPIWQDLSKKHDGPAVTASFEAYLTDPDLPDVFSYLMEGAPTLRERGYWAGRLHVLEQWKRHPERLDRHGQYAAMALTYYRNKQDEFPLPSVRAGTKDMIDELLHARQQNLIDR